MSPFKQSVPGGSRRFRKPFQSAVKFRLPLLAAVFLFFACDFVPREPDPQITGDENHTSQTTTENPDTDGETPETEKPDLFVRYAPKVIEGIPADFENGLWLQYHFMELEPGGTTVFFPRRVPEGVINTVQNDLYYPKFNFEIVAGDGVISIRDDTIPAANSNGANPGATINRPAITAVRPGVAVVRVTYDAFTHPAVPGKGKQPTVFPAISEVNSGYVVFSVKGSDASDIEIVVDTGIRNPYDTVYFTGDGRDWPITVRAEGAKEIEVVLNGETLNGNGGNYVLPLKNTQNVVGVRATDSAGKNRFYYTVIDARKIAITVTPEIPEAGKSFGVSFRGITLPVHKLATIYNPALGSGSTVVRYELSGTEYRGKSPQYRLATDNAITVKDGLAAGTHTFTGGAILQTWYGDDLESEKNLNLPGNPNMAAVTRNGVFGVFPEFTVTVR